jgi:hypothetical protein
MFSITTSNDVMLEKERVKSLKSNDIKNKLVGNTWRQHCSVPTCENYSQQNDLCVSHFNENENQQQPMKTIDASLQSSAHSKVEESNIISNSSMDALVTLTQNLTEQNNFDRYSEFFRLINSLFHVVII